jgi:circadian clock protein KaiC
MAVPPLISIAPGLDFVLGGGLPADRLYLLEGDPGTGKTTLALQFLLEGVRRSEPALYVTLSETNEELRAVAESHGWTLDGITIHELAHEEALRPDAQYTVFHPSEVELADTMSVVFQTLERVRPRRAVFDSLSEMRLLARDPLRYRRQILALKQFFAGRGCTVLVVDDRTGQEQGDLQLHSLAHGVIRLEQVAPEYGGARRRLRIMKLRGVQIRTGYHDFGITRGGVVVYPRLVAAEHHRQFPSEFVSSGVREIDALIGGGLMRGTTALVLGPAGCGKTLISAHFAHHAAARGEPVAVYLFDEGTNTYFAGTKSIGRDMAAHVDAGRAAVRQVDPAELTPGEFVASVREAVEVFAARVVVIDSLNGYLNAMPEERYLAAHLHELFSYLRQQGVVTLVVMSQHGVLGTMQSTVDVSYVADTVLLTRYFEIAGTVRKAISVVKKRAGQHEDTIREFRVTADGIQLGQPLTNYRGILTGVPQPASPPLGTSD